MQAYVGNFILREAPDVLVVETAMSERQGACTGNEFDPGAELWGNPLSVFCVRLGRELASAPDASSSSLWQVGSGPCPSPRGRPIWRSLFLFLFYFFLGGSGREREKFHPFRGGKMGCVPLPLGYSCWYGVEGERRKGMLGRG